MAKIVFKTTVDRMKWYGGDAGYGIPDGPNSRKQSMKSFSSAKEALAWAYSIVSKSDMKATNQHTERAVYSVDLTIPDRPSAYWGVQVHKGKIRVWTRGGQYGSFRGFLLNKDGTINYRGGGIE